LVQEKCIVADWARRQTIDETDCGGGKHRTGKYEQSGQKKWSKHTVSATLTLSFLSFNNAATSCTIALTFSGGNSFGVDILLINLLSTVSPLATENCLLDTEPGNCFERIGCRNSVFMKDQEAEKWCMCMKRSEGER
jgi:uncharacterized protein (DUF2237 family)